MNKEAVKIQMVDEDIQMLKEALKKTVEVQSTTNDSISFDDETSEMIIKPTHEAFLFSFGLQYGRMLEKGVKNPLTKPIDRLIAHQKELSKSKRVDIYLFNMFSMNYRHDFIEVIWKDSPNMAQHLRSKYNSYYKTYGSMGAMLNFWANLDGGNRDKLETYVLNNPKEYGCSDYAPQLT